MNTLPATNTAPIRPASVTLRAGTATGLVDGPRGILAHTYSVTGGGTITEATILTPTAQNEPWLAALLTRATRNSGILPSDTVAGEIEATLEASIREADPCLPISSAPAGLMGLKVDILD